MLPLVRKTSYDVLAIGVDDVQVVMLAGTVQASI